jgi:iron complex outermembrane receptor protein
MTASRRIRVSRWALATNLLASVAVAQTTATPSASRASAASDTLEEIIVTAEKRASTVQETAISMTALSGAQLQQAGITSLAGVIQDVPGISVRTAGPGQTEIEMRGLSSSGGAAPTVGFYLNDYSLTPPAAALVGKVVVDPDLFDLNRVEVLRGPQGTLYGSGSMGGTIKLVTNSPDLKEFSGTAEAILSQTSSGGGTNYGGNLMLNAPLIKDLLALRVVLTDKYVDGWIDRDVVSPFPFPTGPGPCGPGWPGCVRGDVTAIAPSKVIKRTNWERLEGGRAELLAQPTSDLKLDFLTMFQQIRMGGYSQYDSPPDRVNVHYQPFDLPEPFSDRFLLLGLTATYDTSFAQLTSATAYYQRKESQTQDNSEVLYSNLQLFFPAGAPKNYLPIPFSEIDSSRQVSEELRLASSGSGPLQWIVGGFFSNFSSIFVEDNSSQPTADLSAGGAAANPTGIIYQAHNPYHIKQYAVFGEGTYTLSNAWKVTAGLRWYRFDSVVDEETSGYATSSGNATPTFNSFSASSNGLNPKLTVAYEPNHNLNIYSTIARGFRPGGINQQIPTNVGCNLLIETYESDSTWNYEVGEKARLLEGRLVINSDVYYIKWSKVQQVVNQPCGYPLTENAGNAASYGPELEVTAHLTPELTLALSGTWTHATLTSVNSQLTAADPALTSDTPLLNIPKYTETTSLTYSTPMGDGLQFIGRLNNSYVGPETDIQYTYATLHSYDIFGLRLGLTTERWSAYLFADNLTDKHAQLGINTSAFAWTAPSLVRVATNQPRTIGLDLRFNF